MRKALFIAGAALLIVVALLGYAILNLNRIISENKAYALAKITGALGRDVQIGAVKASLGWGVVLDVTGVKIADDPAFSQLPIIEASEIYGEAEMLPLLAGRLHLRRLVFREPQVRILLSEGQLNLSELGHKPHTNAPTGGKPLSGGTVGNKPAVESGAAPGARTPPGEEKASQSLGALERLAVNTFSIQNGTVSYSDLGTNADPTRIRVVDFEVSGFSASSRFDVSAKLADPDNDQNLTLAGHIGPLVRDGKFEAEATPLDLQVNTSPLLLERLRRFPALIGHLPRDLTISDFFQVAARLSGSPGQLQFDLNTDLSSPAVVFWDMLDKASGVPFKLSVSGWRDQRGIAIQQMGIALASLDLKLANLHTAEGVTQGRLDTNRFDLGAIIRSVPMAADYSDTSGDAEIHADLKLMGRHLEAQGAVALSNFATKPKDGVIPAIANLNATLRMTGNGASIDPASFDLGSGHAKIQADVASFNPLKGNFSFSDDVLKLAEALPSRKSAYAEELRRLSVNGTLGGTIAKPQLDVDLASVAGSVSNVTYKNLALSAAYADQRIDIRSLKLGAFEGAIAGSGSATIAQARPFEVKLSLDNIDLEKALASQKAKAAGAIRGSLTGQIQVSGSGATAGQIEPTLVGSGKATVQNGKLVGFNLVAEAMKKTRGIPGIGDLMSPDVAARHPELFSSPDTDIKAAGLTFTIEGPRITTHDLAVESPDYKLLGNGSFDVDKNVDMKAQIVLTKELSGELAASKKNIVYLTNKNGEVEIPLQIVGALPKPKVVPDIGAIAQTAAQQALKGKAGKLLGGVLGKKSKGLEGLLGGSRSASPLEKLFH